MFGRTIGLVRQIVDLGKGPRKLVQIVVTEPGRVQSLRDKIRLVAAQEGVATLPGTPAQMTVGNITVEFATSDQASRTALLGKHIDHLLWFRGAYQRYLDAIREQPETSLR